MIALYKRDMPAAVYRHINAEGETIYIGCTANPLQRLSEHMSQTRWMRSIARIDVQWFDTWHEARAEELRLIAAERPMFNAYDKPRAVSA